MARDPAKSFRQVGLSRRAAKEVSQMLRLFAVGEVCTELPDAEYSCAPRTLAFARLALIDVVPRLVRDLLSAQRGAPDQASFAIMPLVFMEAVEYELNLRSRRDPLLRAAQPNQLPEPRRDLVAARGTYARDCLATLAERSTPAHAQELKSLLGDLLRNVIGVALLGGADAAAQAWTGWALLAAMKGMESCGSFMPEPGVGLPLLAALGAQAAAEVGSAIVIVGALDLIDVSGIG